MYARISASAGDADGAFRMTWDCIRSRYPSGGCARHVVRRSSVERVRARERRRRRQADAMLRLEWQALRVGDSVLVHDASDVDLRLVPGVVAMVESAKGSSDIGIRVPRGHDGHRVVRPHRVAVHVDPLDPTEPCWRCDAIARMADRIQRVPAGVP
jgi:hypothetical protein